MMGIKRKIASDQVGNWNFFDGGLSLNREVLTKVSFSRKILINIEAPQKMLQFNLFMSFHFLNENTTKTLMQKSCLDVSFIHVCISHTHTHAATQYHERPTIPSPVQPNTEHLLALLSHSQHDLCPQSKSRMHGAEWCGTKEIRKRETKNHVEESVQRDCG